MHIMSRNLVVLGLLSLALRGYASDSTVPGHFTVGRYLDLQSASAPQID
jgi:hypothetical protein